MPDRVKPFVGVEQFEAGILPRLSSGDETLWNEFPHAVSLNHLNDPQRMIAKVRGLPTRTPGRTDPVAYDYVLLVPVFIDNVSPPRVVRDNTLGIDVDADYRAMTDRICKAHRARWGL